MLAAHEQRRDRWSVASTPPVLRDRAVHVWRAHLSESDAVAPEVLSPQEVRRAKRFVRAEDGARWAASRRILRRLLAAYVGAHPGDLRFATSPLGKPVLTNDGAPRFNLSHSGDIALYAVSAALEVGVDVELQRRDRDVLGISKRMFGEEAQRYLAKLHGAEREREFLRLWVRHESAVKCSGRGISGRPQPHRDAIWIADVHLGQAAVGAVAVEREPPDMLLLEWEPK